VLLSKWQVQSLGQMGRYKVWAQFADERHGRLSETNMGMLGSRILFPRLLISEKFRRAVNVCYFDLPQCCTIDMKFNMTAVNNIINK